jgi:hypothetical protein
MNLFGDVSSGGGEPAACAVLRAARTGHPPGDVSASTSRHGDEAQVNPHGVRAVDLPTQRRISALMVFGVRARLLDRSVDAHHRRRRQVSDVETSELRIDAVGDHGSAARITIPVSTQGVDTELDFDRVEVQVGCGVALLLLGSFASDFNDDLRERLGVSAVERLPVELVS